MLPAQAAELIPAPFASLLRDRAAEGSMSGQRWLTALPRLLADLLGQWELTVDGPARSGQCAIVIPVLRRSGEPAALKVTWPHSEAEHEHLALKRWDSNGAVTMLAADPGRWAMVLERLDPSRDLLALPIDDACTVIGQLLAQLDVPALPQLTRLSAEAQRWAATVLADGHGPVPRRLVDQARSLCRDLAQGNGSDARLVHTDLHYTNVLAGARQTWLAIDPKPLAAEPAFAVAPAVWNRWDEAAADGNLRWELRRRVELICEAGGIDQERARAWTIVREVINALWESAVAGPGAAHRVSQAIATIKAMQE